MPLSQDRGGGTTIVVPILFIVAFLLVIVALGQQQATIRSLHRTITKLNTTDLISCQFLNADATGRNKQARNADVTVTAQVKLVANIDRLEAGFKKAAAKSRTPAGFNPLFAYLDAQRTVLVTQSAQSRKNITISRSLAAQGTALSKQLSCAKGET